MKIVIKQVPVPFGRVTGESHSLWSFSISTAPRSFYGGLYAALSPGGLLTASEKHLLYHQNGSISRKPVSWYLRGARSASSICLRKVGSEKSIEWP